MGDCVDSRCSRERVFAVFLPQLIGSGKQPVEVSVLYPKKWLVTKIAGEVPEALQYRAGVTLFPLLFGCNHMCVKDQRPCGNMA